MKTANASTSHFYVHWLPWLALHHFLSAADLRKVVCGMVDSMSHGDLSLSDLFDDQLTDAGASSETWVITPKPVESPLATYLQARIRAIVWSNDAEAYFDHEADWKGLSAHPSVIEAVIRLARRPTPELCARINNADSLANHPALPPLLHSIEISVSDANHKDVSTYVNALEQTVVALETPLRMAALKFAGDNAALADQWLEAAAIYERVLSMPSQDTNPAWIRARSGLVTITAQSLATASRILEGKGQASAIFDQAQKRWLDIDPALFTINSTRSSLNVHTTETNFPYDNRTNSFRSPLVIETHGLERPILEFLEQDYLRASQLFQARLRRQIALGSNEETQVTQATYARNIIAFLTSTLQEEKNDNAFAVATHLLIQSGAQKLASTIDWDKGLVEAYVDADIIGSMRELYAKFDGVRTERQVVAIELLSSWATQLSSNNHEAGTAILKQLAQLAQENEVTPYTSTNIGGRSLKALKDVGERQPEWLPAVAKFVADALVTRLNASEWWTGKHLAAEAAQAYAHAFSDEDLAPLIEAAVQVLNHTGSDAWVVIRPLQNFITSAPASRFIHCHPELERKVIELLIRHGTAEQGHEQANLVHNLRAFDSRLLDDPHLKTPLLGVVEEIKQKAKALNSTASHANIQALLAAPALAGLEGIHVALESLRKILESVGDSSYNLSLSVAYYPLLQIAGEHKRIATGIGFSSEEFLQLLNPLYCVLEKFWRHAASNTGVFMPFSIPPKQVPNPVSVHNWTFASIEFGKLLGGEANIERLIDAAAKRQPSIAKAIARAKAIQTLSLGDENFDEAQVKNDKEEVFYLNLGSRLSQVDISTDEGRAQCKLLAQMCLRHGPNDFDMAAFILAQQCGLNLAQTEDQASVMAAYMARLKTDPDKHLNFLPIFKLLGYTTDTKHTDRSES